MLKMHEGLSPAKVREICERWGFPIDGGPHAGMQAVEAIRRADAELNILFPEQRALLTELEQQQSGDVKVGPFIFGLAFQCMFAVTTDAENSGGLV